MKMAFAAAFCSNLPVTSRLHPSSSSDRCHLVVNKKQRFLVLKAQKRASSGLFVVSSVLKKLKSQVYNADNGTTEPARVLLERLFAKTQKLEQMMNRDSSLPEDAELSMDLEILESDLQAALSALRNKEEDLRDAERQVLQKQVNLNQTKQDVVQQEKDIASAYSKQKEMEEDLSKANCELASQSRYIDDMKILVKKQEMEIANLQSLLSHKERELVYLRYELVRKNEEIGILKLQVDLKEDIIHTANSAIKEQEAEIRDLQSEVGTKERDLAEALNLRKAEQERLEILEADLEKQTAGWLLARNEVSEFTEQARKHADGIKKISEDFGRVRSLLLAVRSELISSQESLASSRRKMQDEALQFEKEVAELDEQKLLLMSYCEKLEAAQLEVDGERKNLRAKHAQYEELEVQLLGEREKIGELEEKLTRERTLMEQKAEGIALLMDEIGQKELEHKDAENALQIKKSELIEARVQIQHMKSEMASTQLILQKKDADLFIAQRDLAKLNIDRGELRKLLKNKEEQLIQATMRLREKEEQIEKMNNELDDSKVVVSESTSVVQRILQLTSKLVGSIKDDGTRISGLTKLRSQIHDKQDAGFRKQQEPEIELLTLKESLKQKEKELLVVQRALAVKEEELRAKLRRWETREKELKEELKEDANGLKKIYNLADEGTGESRVGDLATEKLQLVAAHLEAEAAITALQKLAEMTCQLANETDVSMRLGDNALALSTDVVQLTDSSCMLLDRRLKGLQEAEEEIARLFTLTEELVKDAGISRVQTEL